MIPMRVLITGGAGFIGSHLVDRFLQMGYDVHVLDSLEPRVHPHGWPAYLPSEVDFIRGDVRDKHALAQALRGVDIVSHQAAYQDYMPDYSRFFSTNVASTALIYEIIREEHLPVRKVMVASSQAVYGEGQYLCETCGLFQPASRRVADLDQSSWELRCPQCGRPANPLRLREEYANPFNAYALSKLGEELAALRLGQLLGIPTVALRYSITQGPRQSPFNSYSGICRIFTTRLMNGDAPIIFEDGKQTRDFTHVQDLVDAHMLLLARDDTAFQSYNVGSGRSITVLEYARLLIEVMGMSVEPVISGEYRVGDNRHSVSDISKLLALGWQPQRTLRDIFVDYLKWLATQDYRTESYRAADAAMRVAGVIRRVGESPSRA
jgi:dTDP-L-rhamnose 4-epimerase